MDLKVIMQSEITQGKINFIQFHLYLESKKNTQNKTNELTKKPNS